MRKQFVRFFSILLLLLLCGCWNYRSLSEITIIAGIAIDKSEDGYEMTFEIINLSETTKERGIQAKIIESTGETVFDAVRNAKKRMSDKLYFANAQIVIISGELAQAVGIFPAIDLFIRDAEGRETMHIIISKEKTAKEILMTKGIDSRVISYALQQILDDDNSVTASTSSIQLYHVYNLLNAEGQSLVLPVFKRIINDKEEAYEADGIGVFRKDKLIGFLSPEDTKYFLFTVDQVKGGLFTFNTYGQGMNPVTLEIFKNKTNRSFSYSNNTVKVTLKPQVTAVLAQKETMKDFRDDRIIKSLEKMAEKELERRMEEVIRKVQAEFNSDIVGFGSMINQRNPKLWDKLGPGWDKGFPRIQVEVDATFNIVNSALSN